MIVWNVILEMKLAWKSHCKGEKVGIGWLGAGHGLYQGRINVN